MKSTLCGAIYQYYQVYQDTKIGTVTTTLVKQIVF